MLDLRQQYADQYILFWIIKPCLGHRAVLLDVLGQETHFHRIVLKHRLLLLSHLLPLRKGWASARLWFTLAFLQAYPRRVVSQSTENYLLIQIYPKATQEPCCQWRIVLSCSSWKVVSIPHFCDVWLRKQDNEEQEKVDVLMWYLRQVVPSIEIVETSYVVIFIGLLLLLLEGNVLHWQLLFPTQRQRSTPLNI